MLVDRYVEPGYHQTVWDGTGRDDRSFPSGIYIARLVTLVYPVFIKVVLFL